MDEYRDLPDGIDLGDLPVPEHRPGFWRDLEQGLRGAASASSAAEVDPSQDTAVVALRQDGPTRRRSPLLVAMVAAVSVLVVGSATALLIRPAGEPDPGSSSSLTSAATTTQAPTSSSTTTTTATGERIVSPSPAPWTLPPLGRDDAPVVLAEQWEAAENQSWCSALAPAYQLPEAEDAVARAAYFGGGWGVAWDKPTGPGSTGASEYCADCGRSAFGIAGVGVTVRPDTALRMPNVLEWPDGNLAGYTGLGFEADHPKRMAELVVDGQGCIYQVWSHLGDEHLVRLIESLRFVETLQAEPVNLRQPNDPPTIINAGAAPWNSDLPESADLPAVLVSSWQQAGPNAIRVAFADLGEGVQDAELRTADIGLWGVAWDNPSGPGHDESNGVCDDCGRGVVGLGQLWPDDGTQVDRVTPPIRVQWDDGSYAEVGSRIGDDALPLDRLRFLERETGEHIDEAIQATLTVAGTDTEIVIWSHLGQDHLLYLMSQVRLVD